MLTYPMQNRKGQAKWEYLYTRIKTDILRANLAPGEKLPSKRALAQHLDVSVTTVENAYGQLLAEGYIVSNVRSGYFVSDLQTPLLPLGTCAQPAAAEQSLYRKPHTVIAPQNHPRQDRRIDFPFSVFFKIMRGVIADEGERLLQKAPHFGLLALREAIAFHLQRYRDMKVDARQIVIGAGAEYLYGLIAQYFGPATTFGLESPCYEKIPLVYGMHGAQCVFLEMDSRGICQESLLQTPVDVLHITPFQSFPTGVSADASRRQAYIHWARRHRAYIIEDDFASEFSLQRRPVETMFAISGGQRVIYMNTFSKSLSASMRVGYMVLPEDLLETYTQRLGFYSCPVPVFEQYVLARYIAEGHFERHLNRLRRAMRRSQKS